MASLELFSKKSSPAELAAELKSKCLEHAVKHLGDDFWQFEFGQELAAKANMLADERDWIRQMDNYILFGETENGQKVLDEIIANARLNAEEKETLKQWREQAFPSIFEIKEVEADKIKALDALAEVDYEIYFNDLAKGQEAAKNMPPGSFVQTNILPVNNIWFFSGLQIALPQGSEPAIFQAYVAKATGRLAFRNNPEKLKRALEAQKKHYQVFVDTFGADELIVPTNRAKEKLREYYDNLAVNFSRSGGITAPQLPKDFQEAETIGIVMHAQEGQHEFRDYGKFVKIFEAGDISKKSREFIMDYLEDESTPAFIFKRMKERHPENFHKVMLETTARADKRLYPVDDFDRLMDIFKPGWRETYPAVIPLNRRFEKYYYNLGRNDLCYCGSGKKFKKCHGR